MQINCIEFSLYLQYITALGKPTEVPLKFKAERVSQAITGSGLASPATVNHVTSFVNFR